ANVTVINVSGTAPVRATASTLAGFTVDTPTTISNPASAGIATYPTALAHATVTTAMTAPATRNASRDPARDCAASELALIDAPTALPWTIPDRWLPAPGATKSCEMPER